MPMRLSHPRTSWTRAKKIAHRGEDRRPGVWAAGRRSVGWRRGCAGVCQEWNSCKSARIVDCISQACIGHAPIPRYAATPTHGHAISVLPLPYQPHQSPVSMRRGSASDVRYGPLSVLPKQRKQATRQRKASLAPEVRPQQVDSAANSAEGQKDHTLTYVRQVSDGPPRRRPQPKIFLSTIIT